MENMHPFREIRLSNHFSQNDIAFACSISHQVVLRTEQGLYGMPSPKITNYLSTLDYSSPVAELEAKYRDWQIQHRLYNKSRIEFPLERLRALRPAEKITMPELRKALGSTSSIGFCKLICVHPSQLHRYTTSGGSLYFLEEALRDTCSEDLVQWVVTHLKPS